MTGIIFTGLLLWQAATVAVLVGSITVTVTVVSKIIQRLSPHARQLHLV